MHTLRVLVFTGLLVQLCASPQSPGNALHSDGTPLQVQVFLPNGVELQEALATTGMISSLYSALFILQYFNIIWQMREHIHCPTH